MLILLFSGIIYQVTELLSLPCYGGVKVSTGVVKSERRVGAHCPQMVQLYKFKRE